MSLTTVDADAPSYPFNVRREGWKDNIEEDAKGRADKHRRQHDICDAIVDTGRVFIRMSVSERN